MFREMRRIKQAISREECQTILTQEKRGILSMSGDNGYPYAIPLNFIYDEKANIIYFHCAKQGHKIDAIKSSDKVCFTVLNSGFQEENDWAWNITSVLVFGRARLVSDPKLAFKQLRQLALKYYPTAEEAEQEVQKGKDRAAIIALQIEHMTGKLVKEK